MGIRPLIRDAHQRSLAKTLRGREFHFSTLTNVKKPTSIFTAKSYFFRYQKKGPEEIGPSHPGGLIKAVLSAYFSED